MDNPVTAVSGYGFNLTVQETCISMNHTDTAVLYNSGEAADVFELKVISYLPKWMEYKPLCKRYVLSSRRFHTGHNRAGRF